MTESAEPDHYFAEWNAVYDALRRLEGRVRYPQDVRLLVAAAKATATPEAPRGT